MSTNFPTSLDSYATLVDNTTDVLAAVPNNHADAIEALEAKMGIDSSAVATSLDYLLTSASSVDPGHLHSVYGNFIASGRKLFLYENTSPTGWTTVAVTDSVLAVKGGSQAYNVTGGQTAGTWTQPNHTLVIGEIPSHDHPGSYLKWGPEGGDTIGYVEITSNYSADTTGGIVVAAQGGGGAHSHGTTYRPLACVGIISQKD